MNHSEQINELATALSKAQGQFVPALKDTANPFFKSKYANLCSIVKACQEPLSKNGLCISQATRKYDDQWVLVTKLLHSSGQWIESVTPIITMKSDIQSFGSSCTYARRYAWASICGVTTDEDDDGEGAMNRNQVNFQMAAPQKQKIEPETKTLAYVTPVTPNASLINKQQADELEKMINEAGKTNKTFSSDLWTFITDKCNLDKLEGMPIDLYRKLYVRVESELKKQKANEEITDIGPHND